MPKYLDDTGLATNIQIAKDTFMPKMTVDSSPTANSTNLVTSGGVKTALDGYLPLTGGTMGNGAEIHMDPTSSITFGGTMFGMTRVSYGGISMRNGGSFDGCEVKMVDPNADGGVGGLYVTDEDIHGYFGNNDYTFPNATGTIALTSDINTAVSGKQDTISDLATIRSGAALGATALQSYTETDPTVPSWAKASTKPSYTATEVGAQPTLVSGTNIKTINNESLLGSGNITIKADTSACELLANKVTSLSSSSTDTQYPSAKATYDAISAVTTESLTTSEIDIIMANEDA